MPTTASMRRLSLVFLLFILVAVSVTLFAMFPYVNAESAERGALDISAELVSNAFNSPTDLASTGVNGDNRLFVADKTGLIEIISDIANGTVLAAPFLDITSLVNDNSERGLLGLTFSPDYATGGEFYVYYTNNSGDIVIARYTVSGNPNVANAASAEIIITVPQLADFHNGGHLAFGPDNYLYIGTGDDGFGGDSQGNSLIGKMLRLNVIGQTTYSIPADNPYVGNNTIPDEVWAIGLRNPWRWSFDRQTGDLWIADVGDDSREEVNLQLASSSGGENYGWPCFEGTLNVNGFGCPGPIAHTPPIHEYNHSVGVSITGGYVYRGSSYPFIQGHYFFGDFIFGSYWTLSSDGSGGWDLTPLGNLSISGGVTTFGEGSDGELYLATFAGNVYKIKENTATPTPTNTSPAPTNTATSTPTATATATNTPPGPTSTATNTPVPTSTPVRNEYQHLPIVKNP